MRNYSAKISPNPLWFFSLFLTARLFSLKKRFWRNISICELFAGSSNLSDPTRAKYLLICEIIQRTLSLVQIVTCETTSCRINSQHVTIIIAELLLTQVTVFRILHFLVSRRSLPAGRGPGRRRWRLRGCRRLPGRRRPGLRRMRRGWRF